MTIHPRTHLVNKARNEIEKGILDYLRPIDLTGAEVAYLLSELAFRWTIVALREERAALPDQRGAEAEGSDKPKG